MDNVGEFGAHEIIIDAPVTANGTYRWNGLGYRMDGPSHIGIAGYEYYKICQLILPESMETHVDQIRHRVTQNQWHVDINPNGLVQVKKITETNWYFV